MSMYVFGTALAALLGASPRLGAAGTDSSSSSLCTTFFAGAFFAGALAAGLSSESLLGDFFVGGAFFAGAALDFAGAGPDDGFRAVGLEVPFGTLSKKSVRGLSAVFFFLEGFRPSSSSDSSSLKGLKEYVSYCRNTEQANKQTFYAWLGKLVRPSPYPCLCPSSP